MKHTLSIIVLVLLLVGFAFPDSVIAGDHVTITILYDNTIFNKATTADWGFSCLIEGFDILANAAALGLSTKSANLVVVSHDHSDHTGGLSAALGSASTATAFICNSFSTLTERTIKLTGATVVRDSAPAHLLPGVQTTGEVSGAVNEQSLIISADSGLVVIMGCSHPGVTNILQRVQQLMNRKIYLVLGGFHWLDYTDLQVNGLIKEMKDMGIRKCGATHCTGDAAIALLRKAFGSDFVEMGVGRVITLSSSFVDVKQENRTHSITPQAYCLDQNYPNPFNPSTTIEYAIPLQSQVMVKIVDLLGREVATLVNQKKDAGTYSLQWDASTMPSGIYFCSLTAGPFQKTKRMILLK
ncbi:MAG: T9SS type A sorting domain-containing protein [Ignavibacteriales bacterium]|nr:T9SS type A sorting domain-containing protein [Ignavibacteriales bacterium]